MTEKKKFLLRIDEQIFYALEKWAADELRSANAQIEFLLKDVLRKSGRLINNAGGNTPDNKTDNNTISK